MKYQRSTSKYLRLIAVLLVCCIALSGCATLDNFKAAMAPAETVYSSDRQSPEVETIKIGVFEPLTGEFAQDAEAELRGIELAHELYPVVLGRPVTLVYADNQSDPQYAPEAAKKLIEQGASVVIGSYGNALTMAAEDVFKDAQIPNVVVNCSNPLITETSDYHFRVCIVDSFQGNSAGKYLLEYLEQDKAAVLMQRDDDYATALVERFEAKLNTVLGGSGHVSIIYYPKDTTDFTPYFEKIQKSGASSVFFPSSAKLADEVIYNAYNSGYYFTWIGSSDWGNLLSEAESKERESLGYLNNVAYVSDFDKSAEITSETKKFLAAYKKYYGDEDPSDAVALAYDAYLVTLQALNDAGYAGSGKLVAQKLTGIFELECATGYITLSANGDPIKDVVIMQIKSGEAKAAYTASPTWGQ